MTYDGMKSILQKIADLRVAVVGDFCLDEYLTIDPAKDEPSLETGLTAYQVVRREVTPGAAGTVSKNLALLGIRTVYAAGYVGDDGRGLELMRGLHANGVDSAFMVQAKDRITSAYVKPWFMTEGTVRESNRMDIKNWTETPRALEDAVIERIRQVAGQVDAMIIMDQLTERNCGVITYRVREVLIDIAKQRRDLVVSADSRAHIGLFNGMILKGNQYEFMRAFTGGTEGAEDIAAVERRCLEAARFNGKPLVVTLGEQGSMMIADGSVIRVPAVPVSGQIDVCGAGDAFTAAFVSALAAGADYADAGYMGNLAASICITQLGSTGRVTPESLLDGLERI